MRVRVRVGVWVRACSREIMSPKLSILCPPEVVIRVLSAWESGVSVVSDTAESVLCGLPGEDGSIPATDLESLSMCSGTPSSRLLF